MHKSLERKDSLSLRPHEFSGASSKTNHPSFTTYLLYFFDMVKIISIIYDVFFPLNWGGSWLQSLGDLWSKVLGVILTLIIYTLGGIRCSYRVLHLNPVEVTLQDLGFRWKTICTNLLNLGIALFQGVFLSLGIQASWNYVPTKKKCGVEVWDLQWWDHVSSIHWRYVEPQPMSGCFFRDQNYQTSYESTSDSCVCFLGYVLLIGCFSLACCETLHITLKVLKIKLESPNASKHHPVYLLRRECAYLARWPCSAVSLC